MTLIHNAQKSITPIRLMETEKMLKSLKSRFLEL